MSSRPVAAPLDAPVAPAPAPGRMVPTRVVSPAPVDEWAEAAELDPESLVCQGPDWTRAICDVGRWSDASRLYEFDDGRAFVLPLLRRRRWPEGVALRASPPTAWGYGGLVGEDLDAAVVRTVVDDLRGGPGVQTRIRPNPLQGPLWSAAAEPGDHVVPGRAHVLDLRGGLDAVRAGFAKSTRRRIRAAERSGLVVECDLDGRRVGVLRDLLDRAAARWAGRQREPAALTRFRHRLADPPRKLAAIADRTGDGFRLWVAWLGPHPVAANLVLVGTNAHATRLAIDPDRVGPTQAGYLLDWLAIQDAVRARCGWYHLGESGTNEGLSSYKERLGATAHEYPILHLERLPVARADRFARDTVKRAIGFRDPG